MLTALIYILIEPLIVPLIIATNINPPKINETDKDKNEDKLTDERKDIIHENFYRSSCEYKGMCYNI